MKNINNSPIQRRNKNADPNALAAQLENLTVVSDLSLKNEIGTLTDLQTTVKSDLVSAVNEVKSSTSTNINNIGNLSNLNTTSKTNLVSALNEVKGNIPTTLAGLSDTDVTNKTNGYGMLYNSTTGKIALSPLPVGSGSGATTMSGLSDVDVTTVAPVNNNVLTYSSGKWVPKAPTGGTLGGTYSLELSRWSVTNSITTNTADVTLSTNNSNGITNAMVWAAANGYSSMVLPSGTYLINEKIPVEIPSYFTLDLGGSTLRVRDNSEVRYGVVMFQKNQMHSRVTNGLIQGDRWNHDYYSYNSDATVFKAWTFWAPNKAYIVGDKIMPTNTIGQMYDVYWQCTTAGTSGASESTWNTSGTTTSGGAIFTTYSRHTHEWGHGVNFINTPTIGANTRHISIDNIEFFDLTGDGIAIMSTYGQINITGNNTKFAWEAGGLSLTTGALVTDTTRVRQSSSIDLTQSIIQQWGYIGVAGGSYGGLGADITSGNPYDLVFYNSNGTFNSTATNCEFFDEIAVPSGATTAKVVLHQSNIPASANDSTSLRVIQMPKNIYIEKCHIYNTRRCGVSITGTKQVWLRYCNIHDISGTGPSAGIDIEDGYMYNQDIFIEQNFFHSSAIELSFVAGKNIQIRGNRVYGGANETWGDVLGAIIEGNMFQDSTLTFIGEMTLSNNYFHRTLITFPSGSTANGLVDNCVFHNSSLSISRDKAYCILVSNSRFYCDVDYSVKSSGFGFTAGLQPQTMVNCSFEGYLGSSALIFGGDSNATEGWSFSNLLFFNNKKSATAQVSIRLPRGTYTNCRFNNPGYLDYVSRIEMVGCSFTWDVYNLLSPSGTHDAIKFRDCTFNGGNSSLFYISAYTGGLIELINSTINYPNAINSNLVIFDGYWQAATNVTGGKVVLDGNRFTSNLGIKVFNNPNITADVFSILMRNNYFEGNVTFIIDSTQIKYNNYINGVLDPSKWASAVPSSGFYKLGAQINDTNMAIDGFMGWVCTTEGYIDAFSPWTANHNYSWGNYILNNGNVYFNTIYGAISSPTIPTFPTSPIYSTVKDTNGISTWTANTTHVVGDLVLPSTVGSYFYKCTTAGTGGSTEPVWGTNSTVTDGTITWTQQPIAVWKLMGTSATFKKFGTLS